MTLNGIIISVAVITRCTPYRLKWLIMIMGKCLKPQDREIKVVYCFTVDLAAAGKTT